MVVFNPILSRNMDISEIISEKVASVSNSLILLPASAAASHAVVHGGHQASERSKLPFSITNILHQVRKKLKSFRTTPRFPGKFYVNFIFQFFCAYSLLRPI
jgi:hypothetical protein